MEILIGQTLADALKTLGLGWTTDDRSLRRKFGFPDFKNAFVFVTEVAAIAERQQHHPNIEISYSHVTLTLSTHDAGGVTERDITLAKAIDELSSN